MPGPIAHERIELELALRVGPFSIQASLSGVNGPWLTRHDLTRRLGPFIVTDAKVADSAGPLLQLNATLDDTAWRRDGTRPSRLEVTSSGGLWHLSRSDLVATMSQTEQNGWMISGTMTPEGTLVEECLRLMCWMSLMSYGGGLFVHGASSVRGGRGYCFPAASGTGKSTLVRLTPGDLALSDEISLLTRDEEGQWWVWPSPFWNWESAFSSTSPIAMKAYPLEALVLLHQGPAGSEWVATEASEALASVLMNVVAFDTLKEGSLKTIDLTIELLEWLEGRDRLGHLYLLKGDDPYCRLETSWRQ